MWDDVETWVEIRPSEEYEDLWQAVFRVNSGFTDTNRWKAFLIGHVKYGSRPYWKTEKTDRGLPENLSQTLKELIGENAEIKTDQASYYSLGELRDINLEEVLPLPEDPNSAEEFKYCVSMNLEFPESDIENMNANHLFPAFKASTVQEALDNDGQTKVELARNYGDTNVKKPVDAFEMEGKSHENLEKVSAVLRVERLKKKEFGRGFDRFIEMLDEMKKYLSRQDGGLSDEDIRLVVFSK
jgi:hypothetical protein